MLPMASALSRAFRFRSVPRTPSPQRFLFFCSCSTPRDALTIVLVSPSGSPLILPEFGHPRSRGPMRPDAQSRSEVLVDLDLSTGQEGLRMLEEPLGG